MCTRNQAFEILKIVYHACDPILGHSIHDAILYGSYARGDFTAESDIDILLTADLTQEQIASQRRAVAGVASALSLDHDITVLFYCGYLQSEYSYLRDTDNIGLEGRLGEILLDLYIESENVRIKREEREAAQRKAAEEQRQKELRRQRWDKEVDKLQALENEAADFERACRIRAYVAAVGS